MKKINRQSMQQWNRLLVLSIAREAGALSQTDIVRKSGLSVGTIVGITRRLRKENYLKPAGKGQSSGGRCPDILQFNASAKYIISALCLHKETRIALVDLSGKVVNEINFPTLSELGADVFFHSFERHMKRLMKSNSVGLDRILALCINPEGIVDARTGTLVDCVRMGWSNIQLKQYFESRFELDTYIENNARAAAFGELTQGAGQAVSSLVYAMLDSGIGVSIIHDKHIFYGAHQMAGETGHTVKDPKGPICRCGKRGCLEILASGPSIIEQAHENGIPGMKKTISSESEQDSFNHILEMAEQGHKGAQKILKKAAHLLGHSLADIINLLDTEMVILDGYMAEKRSPYFTDIIKQEAAGRYLYNPDRKVPFVRGALGNNASIIGGAMLACREIFSPGAT